MPRKYRADQVGSLLRPQTVLDAHAAQREGKLRAGDPLEMALLVWAQLHGLVMLHLAGKLPGEPSFETIRGEIMRLLVTGARTAA